MSEEKLVCQNIVKNYGKKEVLKGINLEIEKGKIYGLIGRNGAGKTTLLSIVSGQNPATSGEVFVDGLKVWNNQDALDKICFSRELNPMNGNGQNAMKVKDYLKAAEIFLPNYDKELANRMINEFELDVKKKICKLSKGMMSMVTIIVALASKAEYTFLDEPVAGLDVVARENFYKILIDEFEKTGRTFIISTHIIEEAADVFDNVIFLDKGDVIVNENTVEFLERAIHVTGAVEDVDKAVEGYEVHHTEKMGRSKAVTVLLKKGEEFKAKEGLDVTIQPMSLQQVFVALCGKEEE